MISYTWEIDAITKKTIGEFEDVIFKVVWKKIGTDENGYRGTFRICTDFEVNQIDRDSFTRYEDLKEETVVGWIEKVVDQDFVNNEIEKELEKSRSHWIQIGQQDLPWNKTEE